MPELPEVEAIARTLRPLVRGQTIRHCQVLHSIAVRPQSPAELRRGAEGQRIEGVERRGKYLLWRLGRGCLLMHFKLDGQLIWFDKPETQGHIDVALQLNAGTLGFVGDTECDALPRQHAGDEQLLAIEQHPSK